MITDRLRGMGAPEGLVRYADAFQIASMNALMRRPGNQQWWVWLQTRMNPEKVTAFIEAMKQYIATELQNKEHSERWKGFLGSLLCHLEIWDPSQNSDEKNADIASNIVGSLTDNGFYTITAFFDFLK